MARPADPLRLTGPDPDALAAPVGGWGARALQAVGDFARRRPLGAAGAGVIVLMMLAAAGAPVIAPYDPLAPDYEAIMMRPAPAHWLGTDAFGRDVFSRIVYGSRTALTVGLVTAVAGATLGAVIGVATAYFGGVVDLLVERLMDVLLSFPLIVLALAVVAVLGNGVPNVVLAITVPMVPRAARVVRASALALRRTAYVDAARAAGFRPARIILRHMLPNVMAPYLILVTAFMGQAILLEASLSFLGLGVAEPTAAWGLMLRGAAVDFAETAPWLALFPGLAISLAVFAFNLFGDSLRDALDPRLRTL